MYRIVYLLLLTLILFSFSVAELFVENICYKADKNDFNQTLNKPHNVIFNLHELKTKKLISLSFSSLLPIPYAESEYAFYCVKKENKPESYECSGDCDSGRMDIRVEDEYLYFNVKFASMTDTPDDPIQTDIRSKEDIMIGAYRTVCPKPHTFQDKKENHLPFVCYTWKGEKVLAGKQRPDYFGCTRHNESCDSIQAKHFGKYPNDHEAHKAYQRCEDSQPILNPNDHTYSASKTLKPFIKNEDKKKELFDSINIKDVSIYDLDYYEDLVIAIGEDDSEETRKLQMMDEHHEAVILRSLDGGKHWSKIGKELEPSVPHNEVIILDNKRILVASSIEGAGGSIILSEDAGETWEIRYDLAFIESLTQIKGNTFIAKTFGPTIKSIDGGKNWVEISSK